MSDIATLISVSSGTDGCPVSSATSCSDLLDVEDNGVLTIGDTFAFGGEVTSGSSILDIEGIPVALVGSTISNGECPSSQLVATGSSLVDVEM